QSSPLRSFRPHGFSSQYRYGTCPDHRALLQGTGFRSLKDPVSGRAYIRKEWHGVYRPFVCCHENLRALYKERRDLRQNQPSAQLLPVEKKEGEKGAYFAF